MATQNNNPQIDTTIDALSQGLSQAKTGASTTIHNWIDTLNRTDDATLRRIAGDLQQLESLLGSGQPDGMKLRQLLDSLGQQTTAASNKATGETANKLRELGRQLSDSADQMKTT